MNALDRLKYIRKHFKMNQTEFADTLEVNQKTVSRWEKGENEPQFDAIKLLTEKLNININWLLTGEGSMQATEPPAIDLFNKQDPDTLPTIYKRVKKIGNSYGVTFPAEFLNHCRINPLSDKVVLSVHDKILQAKLLHYGCRDVNERPFVLSSTVYGIIIPVIGFELMEIASTDIVKVQFFNDAIYFQQINEEEKHALRGQY